MTTEKITVMIVDDDPAARQVLEHHLRAVPGVEILTQAADAGEAYRRILEVSPDILLLDVEMPGRSGFDLVHDLQKIGLPACIIFVTAYDKYAIRAIKEAAFDYLLKPVDPTELLEALARYRSNPVAGFPDPRTEKLPQGYRYHEKIRLKSKSGFILLDPDDIYYCKADWNYTDVHCVDDRKVTVSMTLHHVLGILPLFAFFRISRSVVINLNYLAEVSRRDHTCTLNLPSGPLKFAISRERIGELEERYR